MDNEVQKTRQAEAALRISEQRYERMANTVPVMLYDSQLDAEGTSRFLYVAPGPCRDLLELDPEALLQDMSLVWRLVHPEDLERFRQADLAANQAEKEFSEEVRIITPSGRLKWLLVNSRPNPAVAGAPVVWSGYLQDITERKRAEKEREQYFNFFQTSADLMCIADPEGCFLKTNPAFTETLGYSATELTSKPILEFIHPDDRQSTLDEIRRQKESGFTENFENRYICKDGFIKWLSWRVTYDKHEGVVFATARDITGKRAAEETLRENEERMALAMQAGNMGLYDLNLQTGEAVVNASYALMLGYDPATFHETNSNWIARLHPDDRDRVAAIYRSYVQGDLPQYKLEFRQRTKQGAWKWILSLGKIMERDREGHPLRMLGVHVDIDDRKQGEAALLESEFFFRESQRAAAVGSYKADLMAGGWQSSEVLDELFGIGPDYDRSIQGWLALAHPDDRETLARYLQEEVVAQRKPFAREYRIIRKNDGEIRWVSGRGALQVEEGGKSLHLTGTIQDITDQVQKEEERQKLEAQLQQIQKIESVGRLAGGVAHDFNNMLSVILGHVEMAQQKETVSPALQEHLAQIQQATTRSADIVRQLLAFARKQTVAPKVLDLNGTIDDTLKMIGRLIGEEIELLWRPENNLWPIKMDPAQLDQILTNLCINARDAIDGIGTVILATRNLNCDATFSSRHTGLVPGDYVLLSVSDDGCGMGPELREKIFEPFFTTKEVGQGTGLGLATVYGIVKQNGGFIDVYSEPGQGTSFKIYLPRYLGKEDQAPVAEVMPVVERGRETVLLVEDEPAILDVATQMLEIHGYRVLAAATPGAAIRLAEEHRGEIHLLLTDVVMPEMNGRELAKKLLSLHPELRRLFMSGYTADVIAHHGVLDEGVQFIQKPFTLNALAAKVREVLDS